ncbi:MAG: two-component system chemotaxis sensor kinase CheA, partial [Planctomycetota bacterium]
QIDSELLSLFLGGCEEAISKLEHGLIELEEKPGQPDVLGEVRGVIHTLKGECGVIPFPEAQAIFHEAENQIDKCTIAGLPLPIDRLLASLDWFKSYTELLAENPSAPVPPHEEVLATLKASAADIAQKSADAEPEAIEETQEDFRINFPEEVMIDPTLPEFVVEARGHLEDAEAALLEFEDTPGDLELINRIFRTFHTIKGVAGFMNMVAMVNLAHSTEALLDEFRKENLACTEHHTTLIFSCCDAMSSMLDYLTGGDAPWNGHIEFLVHCTTVAATGASQDEFLSKENLRLALAAENCERAGEAAEASPESADHESQGQGTAGATSASASPLPATAVAQASKPAASSDSPANGGEGTKKVQAKKKYKLENTVKVGTVRLDSLVDMVGELVIAQQMVSQDEDVTAIKSQRLTRNLTQVAKITRDLQASAMSLRMVTMKSTFQKMSRLVRDVAQKSGKVVHFSTAGDDTELDRTVVEEISDPLVHLIRNSIDHGLETPEDRIADGKAAKGNVELRAYHQGGSIVIEIRDDGRGLNKSRIFKKAVERGILSADAKQEDLSENDLNKLIFQPGFSTAETVTDISGRGVGMDVVRRNIEKMRGKIDIASVEGQGTSIFLRLPLTLAIIDGMIVRVGSRRYVIPTLSIEMSFRPNLDNMHALLRDGEMVDIRGMMLPVHRLKNIFKLDDGTEELEDGIMILLEDNGERINLFVDEIIGQQQVVIKNLGKALPQTPCISGGAILGDGRVALILDIDALLSEVAQPIS